MKIREANAEDIKRIVQLRMKLFVEVGEISHEDASPELKATTLQRVGWAECNEAQHLCCLCDNTVFYTTINVIYITLDIPMKFRFIVFLMFLFTAQLSLAAGPCLHYSGSPVTLAGKVKLQTFFGPPNYGENPDTDSRETQAILLLAKPICVEANPAEHEEAEQNQLEVTLVPLKKENLNNYEGKQIAVQGMLYHAHTGHHHTPVLIEIKRIEDVGK